MINHMYASSVGSIKTPQTVTAMALSYLMPPPNSLTATYYTKN